MGKQSCLLFSRYWLRSIIIYLFLVVMPDISMCNGLDCPLKESCYRYKAEPSTFMQSYFFDVPFDKEKGECEHYWPTEIMKDGKDNS